MAASTSSAATLNFGTTPGVQNYFEELQRWEKETFEQMRQRKEEQRAKANDSLTRVQELLEQQKYSIQPSNSTHSKEAITTSNKENVPKTMSSNIVPVPENSSVTKVQTSRKVAVEDIPIQTQGQHALEKIVEQQMEKLMSDDKQVSFPTAHVVEENETQEPKCKIKRPFLKKGAGLQRFMPKPISYPKKTVRKEPEKNNVQNSKPVSLQPVTSEKIVNHDSEKESPSPPFVETRLPKPRSLLTTAPASKSQALHSANGKSTEIGKSHIKEKTAPVLEKEAQELAQYEILEDYAHHVSFSSDSSLITDVLNSEDTKKDVPVPSEMILSQELAHKFKFPEQRITDCSSVDPLTSTVEMLKQRKIELEDQMRNSDQRVKGLKKDVASTVPKRVLNVSLSSDDGDNISVSNSVETEPHLSNKNGDPEVTSSRALLREKLEEVQREIEVYQVECSIVKKLKMQRENELRNLQKAKEEFAKFKQEELDKLNKEIAEKRNQIRREKLTFERYQKLRSDLPGKKEREETSLLKQQYASLQEDMKKKSIKFNAEIKRLRKLLEAAEKDRDTLKIENQRLLERGDNLSISKTKQRERPSLVEMKPKTMISYNKEQNEKIKAKDDDDDDKEEEESIEDPFVSEFSPLKDGVFEKDSKVSEDDEMEPKPHVRFNLDPEIQRFSPESYNSNYIEIQHGDKVERIYNNNERLILFKSGSRKFISADGQRIRFEFYNGDKEESFPNNMQVYTYANGVVERSYPDGLRIVEFPNKQVEKYFPDGTMQATYPNGVVITQRPDGIKETQSENGSVTTIFPSGIVVTKFCSGDKEIRSADFIRREFANGAIKTVYKTGRSETRYPDGRFRVKDRDGNVLYDNIMER